MLCQEALTPLFKRIIERVPASEVGPGCYSRSFLVPKKDGGLHPVLDLCPLNTFLKKKKFKMLTLIQALSVLDSLDWMVALDLKDAYFHIPTVQSH